MDDFAIRLEVLDRDNQRCVVDGCEDGVGVHYLKGEDNSDPENMVTLCPECYVSAKKGDLTEEDLRDFAGL